MLTGGCHTTTQRAAALRVGLRDGARIASRQNAGSVRSEAEAVEEGDRPEEETGEGESSSEANESGSSEVQRKDSNKQWPIIQKGRRLRTWDEIQQRVGSKD